MALAHQLRTHRHELIEQLLQQLESLAAASGKQYRVSLERRRAHRLVRDLLHGR